LGGGGGATDAGRRTAAGRPRSPGVRGMAGARRPRVWRNAVVAAAVRTPVPRPPAVRAPAPAPVPRAVAAPRPVAPRLATPRAGAPAGAIRDGGGFAAFGHLRGRPERVAGPSGAGTFGVLPDSAPARRVGPGVRDAGEARPALGVTPTTG